MTNYLLPTFLQKLARHRAAIEIQFNSVEMELVRRWAVGEVPRVFANYPVNALRRMVKAWWQIYHESKAAATETNRTIFERYQTYPAQALDTTKLIQALEQIEERMNLVALAKFRSVHNAEYCAVELLKLIKTFYLNLNQ